jgi:hypothetical protein
MGVLGVAAAAGLALAGCYSPSLRDCTVSCGSTGDCATGQLCGADGMCASPAAAGHCAMVDARPADAVLHSDAAPPHDAGLDGGLDAPSDAGRTVRLTVQVMGKGSVVVEGAGTCSSQDPDKGNCMYDVAAGVPLTAQAMAITGTDGFMMWSSITCAGQGVRCVFTPIAPTMITARFGHSDVRRGL